jgi:hypothetical protein
MMPLTYIEIGVCVLLLVFLLWKENRRPDRSRLAGRVVATVLAVAALVGLVLPLHYYREVKAPVVVLRQGPSPRGIVAVDWQRRLAKGDWLQVQGKWAGGPKTSGARGTVKLLLTGLGGVIDSALTDSNFTLGILPAQTGRAVYQLAAVSGADTLEREDIPVEVETGKPLKVLILAAAPGFENTFVVNWLASSGQQVANRTTVSKNNYQSSFANMAPRSLEVLTSSLLDGFDVVVADASALPAAGSPGLAVLRRQVEEKGLGLVVRVDSAGPGGVGIGGTGQVQIVRTGDSLAPPYLRERVGLRVLARDSSMRATVGGSLYGSGKVVFTTLNSTYVRMMTGQRQAYASYWSAILRRVSRETQPGEEWQLIPALPRVGEPVTAVVQTGAGPGVQGLIGEEGSAPVTLYLAQEEMLPFRWRGTYWPVAAGWQVVRTLQGDTTWAYVWPRAAWAALYGEQRMRETGAYGKERVRAGSGTGTMSEAGNRAVTREAVTLPIYWAYILFLLSVLFLWVERKMAGMSGKIMQ